MNVALERAIIHRVRADHRRYGTLLFDLFLPETVEEQGTGKKG